MTTQSPEAVFASVRQRPVSSHWSVFEKERCTLVVHIVVSDQTQSPGTAPSTGPLGNNTSKNTKHIFTNVNVNVTLAIKKKILKKLKSQFVLHLQPGESETETGDRCSATHSHPGATSHYKHQQASPPRNFFTF